MQSEYALLVVVTGLFAVGDSVVRELKQVVGIEEKRRE